MKKSWLKIVIAGTAAVMGMGMAGCDDPESRSDAPVCGIDENICGTVCCHKSMRCIDYRCVAGNDNPQGGGTVAPPPAEKPDSGKDNGGTVTPPPAEKPDSADVEAQKNAYIKECTATSACAGRLVSKVNAVDTQRGVREGVNLCSADTYREVKVCAEQENALRMCNAGMDDYDCELYMTYDDYDKSYYFKNYEYIIDRDKGVSVYGFLPQLEPLQYFHYSAPFPRADKCVDTYYKYIECLYTRDGVSPDPKNIADMKRKACDRIKGLEAKIPNADKYDSGDGYVSLLVQPIMWCDGKLYEYIENNDIYRTVRGDCHDVIEETLPLAMCLMEHFTDEELLHINHLYFANMDKNIDAVIHDPYLRSEFEKVADKVWTHCEAEAKYVGYVAANIELLDQHVERCTPKALRHVYKKDGESCAKNGDCVSGLCAKNICTRKTVGEKCTLSYECDGYCENGVCRKLLQDNSNCSSDEQCESKYCGWDNTTHADRCMPLIPNGQKCNYENECKSGNCSNNVCSNKLPVGGKCMNNSECETNNCDWEAEKCIKGNRSIGAACHFNSECLSSKCSKGYCE